MDKNKKYFREIHRDGKCLIFCLRKQTVYSGRHETGIDKSKYGVTIECVSYFKSAQLDDRLRIVGEIDRVGRLETRIVSERILRELSRFGTCEVKWP